MLQAPQTKFNSPLRFGSGGRNLSTRYISRHEQTEQKLSAWLDAAGGK